ncbi:hypothetical protein BV898_17207 [Hypsibius exemplaris]|uniref:Uncharacterized protein n=1 Tax=Hypsibius exemplaris TaxID=2072580 RepID=A0A9X6NN89_HYPEX|nr:hypothetical protein BV898_17207 [Hypsibius exemplaris]
MALWKACILLSGGWAYVVLAGHEAGKRGGNYIDQGNAYGADSRGSAVQYGMGQGLGAPNNGYGSWGSQQPVAPQQQGYPQKSGYDGGTNGFTQEDYQGSGRYQVRPPYTGGDDSGNGPYQSSQSYDQRPEKPAYASQNSYDQAPVNTYQENAPARQNAAPAYNAPDDGGPAPSFYGDNLPAHTPHLGRWTSELLHSNHQQSAYQSAPAPPEVPYPSPAPVPYQNSAPTSVSYQNNAPAPVPYQNPAPISVSYQNAVSAPVPYQNAAPQPQSAPQPLPYSEPVQYGTKQFDEPSTYAHGNGQGGSQTSGAGITVFGLISSSNSGRGSGARSISNSRQETNAVDFESNDRDESDKSGYGKKAVPAQQPAYQRPAPQPVYQVPAPQPQSVYQKVVPVHQPVYQKPTPAPRPVYQQPAPAPQPVYQNPAPAPAPTYQKPAPAVPQPVYQQAVPQPAYQKAAPAPKPVYQQPVYTYAAPVPKPTYDSKPYQLPNKPALVYVATTEAYDDDDDDETEAPVYTTPRPYVVIATPKPYQAVVPYQAPKTQVYYTATTARYIPMYTAAKRTTEAYDDDDDDTTDAPAYPRPTTTRAPPKVAYPQEEVKDTAVQEYLHLVRRPTTPRRRTVFDRRRR